LTPATGARTTRLCRTQIKHRSSACHSSAHGPCRPALPSPDIARRCRVHRIPSRVRDDRDTPLEWGGTADDIDLIWVKPEQKYFCKGGWTAIQRFARQAVFPGSRANALPQRRPGERRDPYVVSIMRMAALVAFLWHTSQQQPQGLWVPAFAGTTSCMVRSRCNEGP